MRVTVRSSLTDVGITVRVQLIGESTEPLVAEIVLVAAADGAEGTHAFGSFGRLAHRLGTECLVAVERVAK